MTWSGCVGRVGSLPGLWSCWGWRLGDGRWSAPLPHGRTSVTADTIFDRTRTPPTVWFTACWLFATQKDGISAQHLQRALEIGSYPTAWAMLHGLRSVLVRPGRDRLTGTVQADERSSAGMSRGCAAAGPGTRRCSPASRWKSSARRASAGAGWRVLADGSAESLHPFVTGAVEPAPG